MTSNIYRSPAPYPRPKGLSRNIRYARILQTVYSSGASELTSIHQYIYHHIITEGDAPEISRVLREIALVEMHHLYLLGECILQLGLHPTFSYYQGTRRARWNSGFVQYARQVKGVIELGIYSEEQSIECLKEAAAKIPDEQIVALLNRLVEDEELHLKILLGMRDL